MCFNQSGRNQEYLEKVEDIILKTDLMISEI